jgi:heat shock protein HtpX
MPPLRLAFAGSFAARNDHGCARALRSDKPQGKPGDQMLPAYGLYGHIRNNNIKSTVLMASFALYVAILWFVCCLLWIGLSTKFDPIIMRLANQHLPTFAESLQLMLTRAVDLTLAYAFIPASVVLIWFVAAFLSHQAMIRAGTGAQPIIRSLEWDLYNMVENLSITAGLPMPKVEIIETEALNAYASGLGSVGATIAVTRGLLETLTKDELETVLAHELTHIRNKDTRLMVVAIIFVGILAFGAHALGRTVWGRKHGQPLGGTDIPLFAVAAALAGLAYLFGMLAQFALSRTREYLADAGAVELTKRPECLVSALRKISGREEIPGLPASFHAMNLFAYQEPVFDASAVGGAHCRAREICRRGRNGGSCRATRPRQTPFGESNGRGCQATCARPRN